MKTTVRFLRTGRFALLLLACSAFVTACGSDVSGEACEEGEPCEGGVCVAGVCVAGDAVGGDATDGISPPPIDTGHEPTDAGATDTPPPPDVPPRDIPVMDTVPPDLIPDRTGPRVVDFSPADGEDEVPAEFVVRVEFDEPVRPTTIVQGTTFSVLDVVGAEVPGSLELLPDPETPNVIVFRPSGATLRGSPYRVTVTPSIMDLAGNPMAEYVRFRFFTQPLTAPEEHRTVAERFAPHIRQSTQGPRPEYDYVTAFDFDRDWDFTNNVDSIKTTDAVPAKVYYSVIETKSHWFVTYLYFHPYRQQDGGAFGNDLAGAQVVVQRFPEPQPILLQLFFKTDTQEDILAYTTTESGLVGDAAFYSDGTWPQAELFPEGRYPAYLTPVDHQSCLWIDRDNTQFEPCQLAPADIDSLAIVEYEFVGPDVAEALVEEDGLFPFDTGDDPVAYALEDVLLDLWPRRLDDQLFSEDFRFTSSDDPAHGQRPGAGLRAGLSFVNPTAADRVGRPAWAWMWKPRAGSFVDLPRGTFFFDPAYFVKKRFSSLPDWDSDAKTGFSLDYCYNPFLNVNLRPTDAECAPQQ